MTSTTEETPGYSTQVVSLEAALELPRAVWDALAGVTRPASPFRGWRWHQAWWDTAPILERSEACCVVARVASPQGDGEVVGLLPIRSERRGLVAGLSWAIEDLGCPDHLAPLAADDAALAALISGLTTMDWSVLSLHALDRESAQFQPLLDELEGHGWEPASWTTWACPRVQLAPSWDEWLATQSSSRRQSLRRKLRRLDREHDVEWRRWDASSLDEGWSTLLDLHERRWGAEAPLLIDRIGRLVRRFCELMATDGRLWLLTLHLDGAPAAAWLGFAAGDTLCYYQGERDPRFERAGAGSMLMAHAIREATEAGFTELDLLRGDEPYKMRWCSDERPAISLVARRQSLGGLVSKASDALSHVARERWQAWKASGS